MTNGPANDWMERINRLTLPVGVVALVLCFAFAMSPTFRTDFFNAYLFAWLFWLGISLGSMALCMLHTLTGGGWGVLIRPISLSAARVLPLLFALFLPILFGLQCLFPWAVANEVTHDPILRHIHVYLNPTFFTLRFIIYFAGWIALSLGLTYSRDEGLRRRISAGGLVVYVVFATLASVDWIMSRQAHWISSVFGFITVVSQALTALCFAIVVLSATASREQIVRLARPKHFIDLGNLLLMLVILWAYMNFAQFLIIWTGNEQSEIGWYVQRTAGGWRVIAGVIIFIHFLVPFLLLLFRPLKQDIRRLGRICAGLFFLRMIDLYWNVGPQQHADPHSGFFLSPLAILAWVGIGGLWFAMFYRFLKKSAPPALREDFAGDIYDANNAQSA